MVWSMPLQIILALYFLYQELGPSIFSGMAILALLIPFNTVTSKFERKFQSNQMKCKDKRIRTMYEILNCIKVIKVNAWEKSFLNKTQAIRDEEVDFLRKKATLKSFINFIFGCAPIMVTLARFVQVCQPVFRVFMLPLVFTVLAPTSLSTLSTMS